MTHLRSAPRLAWLGALLAALLVALLAPALARADEGTAGGTAVAEQPATTADAPATGQEPAPADAPAADETAAPEDPAASESPATEPAATEPAATEPAATAPAAPPSDGATSGEPAAQVPTAPPSSGEVDLPTIALPPLGELVPTEPPAPAGELPATSAPSLPELVPLIAAPEAPRAALVVPPADAPADGARRPGRRDRRAARRAVGRRGGGRPRRTARPPCRGPRRHPPAPCGGPHRRPRGVGAVAWRVDQFGSVAWCGRRRVRRWRVAAASGGPVVFGAKGATAQIAAPQLVSPAGPAPAQSLLAVLASYILPGSGPVPAGTVFLLVMLGVILLAAYAPRPGGSERIWLSGLCRSAEWSRLGGAPARLVRPLTPGRGGVSTQRLCGSVRVHASPSRVWGVGFSSAFVKGLAVIQPMQILVLGPEGLGRSALLETLTRLGYVVMAAEARPDGQAPASGDIVMLDMRGEDADWGGLAEGLVGDDRPVMIVSERPRRLMRALSGRAGGDDGDDRV